MGRNVIMTLLLVTMLFSGGLIPTYLVVQHLGHAGHPLGAADPAGDRRSGR